LKRPDQRKQPCEHCFRRLPFPKWLFTKYRWTCVYCGFNTKHYDSIDRAMTRPIHPRMAVAYKGFNTCR